MRDKLMSILMIIKLYDNVITIIMCENEINVHR